MSLKIHPVFRLLLGLSVFLGIALWVQHGFHSRSKTLFMKTALQPRLVLKNATIVGWDQGQRLWQFSGDELAVDHDNHYLNYKGHGIGQLFYKDKPFVRIYAPRLRYDMLLKNAQAFKGVRLYAHPSMFASTQELYWNQTSQHLYIPGKVDIRSPYGTFHGHRLLLMAYEGRVTMSDVRMNILVEVPPELSPSILRDHPIVSSAHE